MAAPSRRIARASEDLPRRVGACRFRRATPVRKAASRAMVGEAAPYEGSREPRAAEHTNGLATDGLTSAGAGRRWRQLGVATRSRARKASARSRRAAERRRHLRIEPARSMLRGPGQRWSSHVAACAAGSTVLAISSRLGRSVVHKDKISWPTRGPNVDQTIGSTMRSGREV